MKKGNQRTKNIKITENEKRLKELIEIVKQADETKLKLLLPTLEDLLYLETQIEILKTKDQFISNPKNPNQIKKTDAHSMLLKLKQSYNNSLKIVLMAIRGTETEIDDGLDAFMEQFKK